MANKRKEELKFEEKNSQNRGRTRRPSKESKLTL